MEYQLSTGVWEITMACNMRCGHCGSHCTERLPGELETDDALRLCDELAELGLKRLTLSGGEPFMREDWPLICKRLSEHDVTVNVISNGWLVDEELIDRAMGAGLVNIGMSLDGVEKTHDALRRPGAFGRVLSALGVMQRRGYPATIVTTVIRDNLAELPEIQKILEDREVKCWQIQLGLPMGNLTKEEVIHPSQVEEVISFAETLLEQSPVKPILADSIGYYTKKAVQLSESYFGQSCGWLGCQAGKTNIGILHDGSIVGCTSIREPQFIEGNIRETSLHEIWTRPAAFAWNRELTKDDLTGFCGICHHGAYCLGGCSNTKLTITGGLTENPYCAYRTGVERLSRKIEHIHDVDTLIERARKAETLQVYEIAEQCLSKALTLEPENLTALKLWGYTWFKLGDFSRCLEINRKAVSIAPNDAYVQKGLGVSLAKLGHVKEGVKALRKAIAFAASDFMDPYYDLAVIFLENNLAPKAVEILEEGRSRSVDFQATSEELYQHCLDALAK